MGTNVPAPTFGPTGFSIPTQAQILAGVQQDINAAFGGNLNFTTTSGSATNPTPQGQLAASWAAIIGNVYATFLEYTNLVDPANSSGRMQDAIARIYFLERLPSAPTTVQATCTGLAGVTIPVGAQAVAADNNIYTCTQAGEIPTGGSIALSFACTVNGPIACPAGTLETIYQAIPGWDTITNLADGVLGQDVESRYQFEARRQATIAGNSVNSNQAMLGALLVVPNVLGAYVVDNPSNSPATIGGVSIPANTQYVAVVGGAAAAVGEAIWSKKPPGIPLYAGNTDVVVQDTSEGYTPPYPSYTITWENPPTLPIMFAVNIVAGAGVPANADVLIQSALANAFAGGDGGQRANIGSLLLATRYVSPITALGGWAQVRTLQLGSANAPDATFVGYILGTTLTVVSLTSGTIAIGQTVVDLVNETILPGVMITAGSGSSWTVDFGTTSGATFTGSGSGTNLTASSVTGNILPGQIVTGTGAPSNTTIVSQTSGTPGGAGVYVTSNSTTSSGASLTASATIYGVVADETSVQVNINQVPTINSFNVTVTVS